MQTSTYFATKKAHRLIPFLSLFLLVVFSCAPLATTPAPTPLIVLAAASLSESFTEIGRAFEVQNPGVRVIFSFAGSQQLLQQLNQGIVADVFASASPKYSDAAVDSGHVRHADVRTFARNRLVVIFSTTGTLPLQSLADLARPGLMLDLADKSVPAGQYALDFLDKASLDPAFDPQFKVRVLKNVVSYEDNVKAVFTKVSLGEADAGIVYATDITPKVPGASPDAAARVAHLDIPDPLNTPAVYPIAPLADSRSPSLASAFTAFVLSPAGQSILARYNFLPANP